MDQNEIDALLKKMNFKDTKKVLAIYPPDSFGPVLTAIRHRAEVSEGSPPQSKSGFIIAFFRSKKEVDDLSSHIDQALIGDGILWCCYPKQRAKRYQDFNRDKGWDSLERRGFAGFRQVSIDDVWSAIRFRRKEYIPKMPRKASGPPETTG